MNTRKNQLKSLFGPQEAADPPREAGEATAAPREAPPKRAASGAVRAMGLSLGALHDEVEDARRLRETMGGGDRVVEIDPARIERSPFADRLSEGSKGDQAFAALTQSIREHGQQVPVLVRPHPDPAKAAAGFYQSAYGHRRVRAAREIGQPVRAVVKTLSDQQLVVAQGKENAERRDLSFIERAFFARALVRHGFDRATAQVALAVHKSEMSRLLQVAEAMPPDIVRAIGPAPRIGRPRWLELGELLRPDAAIEKAADEMASTRFQEADSDRRFQLLFERLSRKRKPAAARPIRDEAGRSIASLRLGKDKSVITIQGESGAAFAEFVAEQLPRLLAEHAAAGGKEN